MISKATKVGFGAALAVVLTVSSAVAMGGNLATKGEALLTDQCAKCHAIGAEGDSKIATVKPFRDVIGPLPADDLGNAFIAAMTKKHAEFKFEATDAKAVGDYLDKLKAHLTK